jgi:hypothetical protein
MDLKVVVRLILERKIQITQVLDGANKIIILILEIVNQIKIIRMIITQVPKVGEKVIIIISITPLITIQMVML